LLSTSVGVDDLSGTRAGLTITPTKMLDLKGEKSLSADLGYLMNNAKGTNNRYQKMTLGTTYSFPAYAKGTGLARLDYSIQDYSEAAIPRKDTVINLTGTYVKDLNKVWNMMLSLQLTNANSEVDSYKYDKYVVTSLFTYSTSILQK